MAGGGERHDEMASGGGQDQWQLDKVGSRTRWAERRGAGRSMPTCQCQQHEQQHRSTGMGPGGIIPDGARSPKLATLLLCASA